MKFIEFMNFEHAEMNELREMFRASNSGERWVEWRVGLKDIVPSADLTLINVRNVDNPWIVKKLSDVSSAKSVALYGVNHEVMGLPFVCSKTFVASVTELLGRSELGEEVKSTLGDEEKTCPMPLNATLSNWGDLIPRRNIPSYV